VKAFAVSLMTAGKYHNQPVPSSVCWENVGFVGWRL